MFISHNLITNINFEPEKYKNKYLHSQRALSTLLYHHAIIATLVYKTFIKLLVIRQWTQFHDFARQQGLFRNKVAWPKISYAGNSWLTCNSTYCKKTQRYERNNCLKSPSALKIIKSIFDYMEFNPRLRYKLICMRWLQNM